ncbi:hypothetical protein [Bradyrhizobium sp. 6(2017)]|uniref:hypothetical protein n=1 Tax=Bradyrhizobium sp. 6(2017) TaxID=1197460 RepID=UPI0013E12549|nr:hypothetical protein [Bradyrhizobium sp. 6(2017)]QIG94410.1 hypothetical protein G6P99_19310 [Bradyrhizobium sp. 6(2017)]
MSSLTDKRDRAERQEDERARLDEINTAFAEAAREDAGRFESIDGDTSTGNTDTHAIRAAGRLSDARKVFADRGWKALPCNTRGRRILRWGADHAWLANPNNPKRGVRNWCRKWARLKPAELDQLIVDTEVRFKRGACRWSDDESAVTLEITVTDRTRLGLRFIGACNDLSYEIRLGIRREKNAACQRRRRAEKSTGRPRGRPALNLSPEEKKARSNAKAAERMRNMRALRKNASPAIDSIKSSDAIKRNISRPILVQSIASISVTDLDGIDFSVFGIISMQVMSGTRIVREWRAG